MLIFFQKQKKSIYYFTDNANWVIKQIGISLKKHLFLKNFKLIHNIEEVNNAGVIHFATKYDIDKIIFLKKNKKIKKVLTYFHGDDNDLSTLKKISSNQEYIDFIHTSCSITTQHLLKHGIKKSKIVQIPIGIEINDFVPMNEKQKREAKKAYGIKEDSFIIGSFQKDGNGWESGDEPKLIKGPDIFCEAVKKLYEKNKNILVILTGPARGYVKKRLAENQIPYKHLHFDDYVNLCNFFGILDLYIVASRLEGGPRALLESMAAGVPLVSTRVGMAPEIINDGQNGYLVEVEDVDGIVKKSQIIIKDKNIREKFIENGLKTVKNYDYSIIAKKYYDQIYRKIM